MGHEAIGVVDALGADVARWKTGNLVVMPFRILRRHLRVLPPGAPHPLLHGGFLDSGGDVDGAQAEALRVPQAAS